MSGLRSAEVQPDVQAKLDMSLDDLVGKRSGGKSGGGGKPGDGGGGGSSGEHVPEAGARVHVKNLSFKTSWQELKEHFQQAGEVLYADVMMNEDGRSIGRGKVTFATAREAAYAIETLDETSLNGRPIKVYPWDKPQATSHKPQATSHKPSLATSHVNPQGGDLRGQISSSSKEWRKHIECYEDEATKETVVRLYETDVVRIGVQDITLDSGGTEDLKVAEEVFQCINDALAQYTFELKDIRGEWFLSDGKFRLIRFYDGVVISGAAKELKAPEAPSGKGGPVRLVKSPSLTGQQRYKPY